MNQIVQKLNDPDFCRQEFQAKKSLGKTNVLFVNPVNNHKSLYTHMIPFYVLKSIDLFNVCITPLNDKHPVLSEKDVFWADTIVFPYTWQPLKALYGRIRQIKPGVKLIYYLNYNAWELPAGHPDTDHINLQNIEDNIFYAGMAAVTNRRLSDYVMERISYLLATRYGANDWPGRIATIPIVLDQNLSGATPIPANVGSPKILRAGIICDYDDDKEIYEFRKTLRQIRKKFDDTVKIIILGKKPRNPKSGKDAMHSIKHDFVSIDHIGDYFTTIQEQKIDVLINPSRYTLYNETTDDISYFCEATQMHIPVIVRNRHPYAPLLDDTLAFLYEKDKEVPAIIQKIMKARKKGEFIGKKRAIKAFQLCLNNFSITPEIQATFDHIFSIEQQ